MNRNTYGSLKPFFNHFDVKRPVEWNDHFLRKAPVQVEIGFGTGEYLVSLGEQFPDRNFVGLEEHSHRIHKTLKKIHLEGLDNIRVLHLDVRIAFERFFKPRSIEFVHCLFPCPWPKKKHIKHRLFSEQFLNLVNNRLADNGGMKLVTDFNPYKDWVLEEARISGFSVESKVIDPRYNTKFERKWLEGGQDKFFEMNFIKTEHRNVEVREDNEVRAYFLDDFHPQSFHMPDHIGSPNVIFKDFLFDEQRAKGVVHVLVAEDYLRQHFWVTITKIPKGWCVAHAEGAIILPTEGIAKAVELVYKAAKETSGQASLRNSPN